MIQVTTPPQIKKRKAEECVSDALRHSSTKSLKTSVVAAQRPSTPVSEHGSPPLRDMDSEDEFMSDPPSGDEEIDFDEGTQDSDIGSIDGGTYCPNASRGLEH